MNRSRQAFLWLGVLLITFGGGVALSQDEGGREPDRERNVQRDRPERDEGRRDGGPRRRGGSMEEAHLRRLLGELDLTDEQKAQIREALEQGRQTRAAWWRENHEQVRELREAVGQARKDEDRDRFREHWAALGELMFEAPERGSVIDDVRDVLTEEQRARLDEHYRERREQAEQRRSEERRDRNRDRGDKPRDGDDTSPDRD